MATIVTFPRERRPASRRNEGRGRGPAKILIFPGVRIERFDFSLSDRLVTPRRRGRPSRAQALEADKHE